MMTARVLFDLWRQADRSPVCEELAWDSCPVCGSPAAVGRELDRVSVECTAGCPVTPALVAALEDARA